MGFMTGKRALIVGLASDRSIAYGIAEAFRREGAELAFTYQNERLKDRVVEMAAGLGSEDRVEARLAHVDAARSERELGLRQVEGNAGGIVDRERKGFGRGAREAESQLQLLPGQRLHVDRLEAIGRLLRLRRRQQPEGSSEQRQRGQAGAQGAAETQCGIHRCSPLTPVTRSTPAQRAARCTRRVRRERSPPV